MNKRNSRLLLSSRVNLNDFYIHPNSFPPRPLLIGVPRNEPCRCIGPEHAFVTAGVPECLIAYRSGHYPGRNGGA